MGRAARSGFPPRRLEATGTASKSIRPARTARPRSMREILGPIEEGRLSAPVSRTYPLTEAAAALDESRTGHPRMHGPSPLSRRPGTRPRRRRPAAGRRRCSPWHRRAAERAPSVRRWSPRAVDPRRCRKGAERLPNGRTRPRRSPGTR
ncbi:zinc-binding dehydrogenase [Streptomyces sp. PSKA30]|uniref:zinc-binding dehydrogenase n=1 Tax=Streptomyces sp. PSKA30 TaxID=2874597 RepID=UPI001CD17AE6|nr:zinc-binding dehydrogenase [Streptomyces sp. PSKA30]